MSVSAGHQVLVSRDAGLAPETAGHRVLRLAPACDVSLQAHVTLLYDVIFKPRVKNLWKRRRGKIKLRKTCLVIYSRKIDYDRHNLCTDTCISVTADREAAFAVE